MARFDYEHFASDLLVGSGGRVRILAGPPISLSVGDEIARIPGVARVEPFRIVSIRLRGRPAFLQGVSVADRLARGGLPMVEGDFADAAAALEAGGGVCRATISPTGSILDSVAESSVDAGGGAPFRIEGLFTDYLGSLDMGSVAVAQDQLESVWGDHFANLFRVWLAPRASPKEVRAAILARFPSSEGYYVLTAGEFLQAVQLVLSRFFVAAWVLEVVAALVSVIGVVNAQVATVLDRPRRSAR